MIGHSKRRAKQLGLLPEGQTTLKQSEDITRWAAWYRTLTVQADAEWTDPASVTAIEEPRVNEPVTDGTEFAFQRNPYIVDVDFYDVPPAKPLAHFLQKILNVLELKQVK